MTNSRRKGANGELEIIGLMADWLGVRMNRNLEQARFGGYDLTVHIDERGRVADELRKLAIEIKRHKSTLSGMVDRWWMQAVKQAHDEQLTPILIYRGDRQPWEVAVPMGWLVDGAGDESVKMGLQAFMKIVREKANE